MHLHARYFALALTGIIVLPATCRADNFLIWYKSKAVPCLVRDAATGIPVKDALASMRWHRRGKERPAGRARTLRTGENGAFRVVGKSFFFLSRPTFYKGGPALEVTIKHPRYETLVRDDVVYWDFKGGGGFLYGARRSAQGTDTVLELSPISWNNYVNTDFHFTVEYPKDWNVQGGKAPYPGPIAVIIGNARGIRPEGPNEANASWFSLSVTEAPIEGWPPHYEKRENDKPGNEKVMDLGEFKGKVIRLEKKREKELQFRHDKKIFRVRCEVGSEKINADDMLVCEDILSSFKMLPPPPDSSK